MDIASSWTGREDRATIRGRDHRVGLAATSALQHAPGAVVAATVAFYGVTVILAALGIYPVKLRGADYGSTMWPEHWDQAPSEIKHAVVEDVAAGAAHNDKVIERKARVLVAVLGVSGLEAVLVGIGLIAARFA